MVQLADIINYFIDYPKNTDSIHAWIIHDEYSDYWIMWIKNNSHILKLDDVDSVLYEWNIYINSKIKLFI